MTSEAAPQTDKAWSSVSVSVSVSKSESKSKRVAGDPIATPIPIPISRPPAGPRLRRNLIHLQTFVASKQSMAATVCTTVAVLAGRDRGRS